MELFAPFSLVYAIASYGCCCSCCSCSTRVEKEKEVVATQEHKKPSRKRKPKKLKVRKEKGQENLPLSTLNDRKQFFLELNWIEKKERKRSVCKQWPCNNRCEHLEIQFNYGGNFP